jgi:hypothetical protein
MSVQRPSCWQIVTQMEASNPLQIYAEEGTDGVDLALFAGEARIYMIAEQVDSPPSPYISSIRLWRTVQMSGAT